MSQDEQDAIVGRTMRELREAQEKLEMLKAEAKRRGDRLEKAGHFLGAWPEYMIQEGETVDVGFSKQPQVHMWNDADIFPAEKIRELTSTIRKEMLTISDLTTRLRKLGH
jgi:hypothetical protein